MLFEGDHISLIDKKFIDLIKGEIKKGIISFDHNYYHTENLILSTSIDFVLITDQYSALHFKEIGVPSCVCLVEDDLEIFKDYKKDKIYDVLYFGKQKTDRNEICNYLVENGIKIKIISKYDNAYSNHYELAKTINESKLVLGFTKTEATKRKNNPLSYFNFTYSWKGRPFMCGLCNTLLISEYFPAYEMIFKNNELPIFVTKQECLSLIRKYLSDPNLLEDHAKKMSEACKRYVNENSIENIFKFIETLTNKNIKQSIKIPLWYSFLFAKKNLILRLRNNFLITYFKQLHENLFYFEPKFYILYLVFLPLGYLIGILYLVKNIISFLTTKNK